MSEISKLNILSIPHFLSCQSILLIFFFFFFLSVCHEFVARDKKKIGSVGISTRRRFAENFGVGRKKTSFPIFPPPKNWNFVCVRFGRRNICRFESVSWPRLRSAQRKQECWPILVQGLRMHLKFFCYNCIQATVAQLVELRTLEKEFSGSISASHYHLHF